MHAAGEVLSCLQSALDERFVDDHLGGDIRQFTSLPCLHLLSHELEVSLHSINANRDAIDERERFRVFREHRSEDAWNNASELTRFLAGLLRKIPVLASLFGRGQRMHGQSQVTLL